METTFDAPGFEDILTSGKGFWGGDWGKALACAEKKHGEGTFRICQVHLVGRTVTNPVADLFARRLLALGE